MVMKSSGGFVADEEKQRRAAAAAASRKRRGWKHGDLSGHGDRHANVDHKHTSNEAPVSSQHNRSPCSTF